MNSSQVQNHQGAKSFPFTGTLEFQGAQEVAYLVQESSVSRSSE